VKALLEPDELILRGEIRRRVRLDALSAVAAGDSGVSFQVGPDHVALDLGAAAAVRWAKKIARPPPSLREKLGLGAGAKAFVAGAVRDEALVAALAGARSAVAADAACSVAEVGGSDELNAAVTAHQALPEGSPIWIVHGKGREAIFGEAAVRGAMRAAGFIDTKVAAVSVTRTATRYSRQR
jgi:hypothetical protein